MRQIKFRAWYKGSEFPLDNEDLEDYEKPQMIYNVQKLYDGNGPDNNTILGGYGSFGNLIDNDDFVIQQFTGLLDKNGKETYEGDVITYLQYQFNTPDSKWKYRTKVVEWKYDKWNIYETNAGESEIEVIGNIYESPELLNNE